MPFNRFPGFTIHKTYPGQVTLVFAHTVSGSTTSIMRSMIDLSKRTGLKCLQIDEVDSPGITARIESIYGNEYFDEDSNYYYSDHCAHGIDELIRHVNKRWANVDVMAINSFEFESHHTDKTLADALKLASDLNKAIVLKVQLPRYAYDSNINGINQQFIDCLRKFNPALLHVLNEAGPRVDLKLIAKQEY